MEKSEKKGIAILKWDEFGREEIDYVEIKESDLFDLTDKNRIEGSTIYNTEEFQYLLRKQELNMNLLLQALKKTTQELSRMSEDYGYDNKPIKLFVDSESEISWIIDIFNSQQGSKIHYKITIEE